MGVIKPSYKFIQMRGDASSRSQDTGGGGSKKLLGGALGSITKGKGIFAAHGFRGKREDGGVKYLAGGVLRRENTGGSSLRENRRM